MKKALALIAVGASVAVAAESITKNPKKAKKMARRTLRMMRL